MADAPRHPSVVLSVGEIEELTRYKRAADQLRELHDRGFSRAYVRAGSVVLERPHFEAVCRGTVEKPRGRVTPPVVAPRRTGTRG
ncbi:hypothetical protein [Roseateles sp.]|uniref:hypothetical protein n=1 Tax=Roseateles sp. TaxID=1971397 RepID=UPI0031DB4E56